MTIGANTWIGSNVTIFPNTAIGSNCKIFPGAVLGAIPQDLKFKGEPSIVEIGNETVIREFVTIHRGTFANMQTKVGQHCLIMAYTHIGHDSEIGDHCILANSVSVAGHVIIQDYAVLEGLVAVQQFVTIGRHSFIAGASLVRKDVPPYVKAAREPLSFIGVNVLGLERRKFSKETISVLEDIYKSIFIHSRNISVGTELVNSKYPNEPMAQEIMSFIDKSEKGIIKGLNPDGN